jgi:hypothetical protein
MFFLFGMKIVYSNVSSGFIFCRSEIWRTLFGKVPLEKHIEYFKTGDIDVLSLSEAYLSIKHLPSFSRILYCNRLWSLKVVSSGMMSS